MTILHGDAPGWPGIPGRWTSSAKTGVGTAANRESRVWFTLSHGILNEVYYPGVDQACTRDLGFIVTDGQAFFSEEKRAAQSETTLIAPGVPAYLIRNTDVDGGYRIEKEVLTDPRRAVVLQRVRFVPLHGTLADFRLFALLAPHLANRGSGNTGWVGDHQGTPMLFAECPAVGLALACSTSWINRSTGFVGFSDGWQDLRANKKLTHAYARAESGNVALTGEVDLLASGGTFVLALGFGSSAAEAGERAMGSLAEDFDATKTEYVRAWESWHHSLARGTSPREPRRSLYDFSAAVLRTHESKDVEGGVIASLSVPWGFSKGDDDLGGYHLIWPRDLVETATGFLAIGAHGEAIRVLHYLQATQGPDGHWPQNMWLDGTPYWHGIQLDETALPILLVDLAARQSALTATEYNACWPMVRTAVAFLACNGPVSPEDRWEEDAGYSPFTIAVEIAALLAAADLAERMAEHDVARYLRETADTWNASIERWLYVAGSDLAKQHEVDGYYVRIEPDRTEAAGPDDTYVAMRNRPEEQSSALAASMASPDALAFVRFGMRAADDPRIRSTVKVIDATLRVDTPNGPAWHRYQGDGYGEHDDGSPFDGTGVGRAWPLLTGERAHYELAAGRPQAAEQLAQALEAFAGASGLLPEQVWDAPDIPERELFFGEGSGSARPLVWAHAEYLKLCRSLRDGSVFDRPPQTVQRYLVNRTSSRCQIWRFNHKIRTMSPGMTLRIETLAPARLHWSVDEWRTVHDTASRDTTIGVHVMEPPTAALPGGASVRFTFYWPGEDRWEGTDFVVAVE